MHLLHYSTTNCFLKESAKKVSESGSTKISPYFATPAVFPPGFDQEPSCCSVLWHFLPGWPSSSSGTYTADGASPGQCFCSTALPPQLATAARKWVKGSCGSFLHVCAALLHKSNPPELPCAQHPRLKLLRQTSSAASAAKEGEENVSLPPRN